MQKIATFLLVVILVACAKVPISNRKQLNLLPESDMIAMSLTAYSDFLNENNPLPIGNGKARMVKSVGEKISIATEKYLNDNGQSKRIEGFEWEFNLVEDPAVNAWCMPGGKVVVYTGIMDVTQDEAGLAVVMGHEIAHAIARHGNERMSQQIMIQTGGATLGVLTEEKPQLTRELFALSYGLASGLGSLKFSRQHETEADKMGLVFMAMAGFDPREAPKFWERMAAASGGAEPPEFLSTHPNHDTRVHDLEDYMEEALKYYKP